LELLCELVPTAAVIGVLVNPGNPYHETYTRDIKAAASGRGLQILDRNVRTERDLDTTLANLRQQHADGLVVTDEPLFGSLRVQLVALAARYNIPTIYPWREDAQAGGLISHGPRRADTLRHVGIYAGRILKVVAPELCRACTMGRRPAANALVTSAILAVPAGQRRMAGKALKRNYLFFTRYASSGERRASWGGGWKKIPEPRTSTAAAAPPNRK
jgi:hypothetical protein